MKAARKIAPEVSRDIFVDDVIELSDSDDEDKLASQLNELIERSGVIRRYGRPPFLRRNLWQIFLGQCKWAKISTSAEPRPSPPMLVIYRLENMPDSGDYTAKWECPFCDLYHQFNNRAMLDHHLRLDHSEVPVDWDFDQSEASE